MVLSAINGHNPEQITVSTQLQNDGSEFMMITVGHSRNVVPAPKYHAELGMTSRPTISQKQYESTILLQLFLCSVSLLRCLATKVL